VSAQIHEEVDALALLRGVDLQQRLLEASVDVEEHKKQREGVGKRQQGRALAHAADDG